MAFQQARAVMACLDVIDDETLAGIRVEGRHDALDIELVDDADRVRRGIQAKTRAEPDTWGRQEILTVVRRWLDIDASQEAVFEFATNGSLGPSAVTLRDAIQDAVDGNGDQLSEITGVSASDERYQRLLSVQLNSRLYETGPTLRLAAVRLASLGPVSKNYDDAISDAVEGINALYRDLFERGGERDPLRRLLTRNEIASLCRINLSNLGEIGRRWQSDIRSAYLTAVRSLPPSDTVSSRFTSFEPTPSALGVSGQMQGLAKQGERAEEVSISALLDACLAATGPSLVAGQAGAGKTTASEQLRQEAASRGVPCILLSAEGYFAGNLRATITDAIGRSLNGPVPRRTAEDLLLDAMSLVVFDGGSELSDESFRRLQDELRELFYSPLLRAKLVVCGREMARLRSLIPTNSEPHGYALLEFGAEQQIQLVSALLNETGLPPTGAAQLLDRAKAALGVDSRSPLMLSMCTRLLLQGYDFNGRASLYGEFVDAMASRAHIADFGVIKTLLGVAFSELLNGGVRYSDSYSWAALLGTVARRSNDVLPIRVAADSLMTAGRESGLIVQGGFSDIVSPAHDSLADYLAGLAHARGAAELPRILRVVDSQRVSFLAEISGISPMLAIKVARYLPLLAIQIAKFDSGAAEGDPDMILIRDLVSLLAGPLVENQLGARAWRDNSGRLIVAVVNQSGWEAISTPEGAALLGKGTVLIAPGGPLDIAVRIWKSLLQRNLPRSRSLASPYPATAEAARDAVIAHAGSVAAKVRTLTGRLFRPDVAEAVVTQIGPLGITAQVSEEIESGPLGDRVMWYAKSDAVNVRVVTNSQGRDLEGMRSATSVESYLSSSPGAAAVAEVVSAVDQLTGRWLRA